MLQRILKGYECLVVTELRAAEKILDAKEFDLIVVSLHFDESQMFELIRLVKKSKINADKPIICFCARDTPVSRLTHESLNYTTKALGAWMYLAEHEYSGSPSSESELRRIMERCLTKEARNEIQLHRLDIHRQRLDNQQLRQLLQEQEWSPELKEYLACIKEELEILLKEVTRLHAGADIQRASVAASRDLKDRVASHVTVNENDMASTEENQSESSWEAKGYNPAVSNVDDSQKSPPIIMIADADPHIRNLAGHFLSEAGYKIEYAVDGKEAFDKAKKTIPDVILLEVIIPKLNGISLCRLLKNDPTTQNIKIVVLSILNSKNAAKLVGADAFLSKPLEKKILVDTVSKVVNA
jgi:DNA-binding response OmpR family regulator